MKLFRLRRPVISYEHHPNSLRVSVGNSRCQVLGTCRSPLSRPGRRCRRDGRHRRREDVVQSEREATVCAQSQVSSTVSTVSRCSGQLRAATCPPRHHRTTRFVTVKRGRTWCLEKTHHHHLFVHKNAVYKMTMYN